MPTALSMVVVMVVVIVAVALGDRLNGRARRAVGRAWFDFFLTRPYERFAIDLRQDIETTSSCSWCSWRPQS
jgi:K+-sensing histidine kinase KdpD